MTLDEALAVLVKRLKHPRLGGLSKLLHQALIEGRSLSQAMKGFPRIFSPLYYNMVSAGEASGALPDILKRLVKHLATVKALRDKVTQAMVYPAMLVVMGILLILVFIKFMVPQLLSFFTKTGGRGLPLPTQILITANDLLTHYWWVGVLVGGGVYTGFKAFTNSTEGRKQWDTFIWKLPVFSAIIRYRFYAQFARTLGTLMENGVTLLRALELLEDISGNEYVRARMGLIRKAVIDGATMSVALVEQRIFPELFADMMAIGEQSGKFDQTMQMIADVYERELDKQVQITSELIPPLVMLAIAAVVGLIVFAVLSAVFSITENLR
ncbi:MAG: type II secretion system F family protein [Verrucomicrobiota bacterium]